jgi:hypothetical protein
LTKTLNALPFAVFALLSCWSLPAAADEVSAGRASDDITSQQSEVGNGHAHADWAGLWIGVEGLFVFITLAEPGVYELEMMGETEDEKDNIRLPGRDAEGGIAFERDGETLLLRSATGEETGLKWLADMKKCLMVQEFEGFCRD